MNIDNWIFLQDTEGGRLILEELFYAYFEIFDRYKARLKKDNEIDYKTVQKYNRSNKYRMGDWSHLETRITGCYQLV